MKSGNFYFAPVEKFGDFSVFGIAEHSVLTKESAVLNWVQVAEPAELTADKLRHAFGDDVVRVENSDGKCVLVAENVALCFDIFLHILMNIKVVRRNVCNNGNIRGSSHGDELEGGKFHNRAVFVFDFLDDREESPSDVSAFMNGFSFRRKKFGNKGRCGGFSVGTGDCIFFAGAEIEENLHLAGDGFSVSAKFAKGRVPPVHSGSAENDIRVHIVKIAFAEFQHSAGFFKKLRRFAEFFPVGFVPCFGGDAFFRKLADNVRMGNADSDEGDLFILYFFKEFFCVCHYYLTSVFMENDFYLNI